MLDYHAYCYWEKNIQDPDSFDQDQQEALLLGGPQNLRPNWSLVDAHERCWVDPNRSNKWRYFWRSWYW